MGKLSFFHLLFLSFTFFFISSSAKKNPLRPKEANNGSETTNPSPFYACDPARFGKVGLDMTMFAYCDKSLPFDVRVKELVDSMTLDEKIIQLAVYSNNGVPRLGLPQYSWWSEALHGVSNVAGTVKFNSSVPGATSFPTPIVTAASFNESLWKAIGQAVSTEARAIYNVGNTGGLTYWSPNINVVRDPRWGRTLETPGEDPLVVGKYAVNYVRGLQDLEGYEVTQDLNTRPVKVAACCKHYAAYDLDNWLGVDRFHFNANVTEQDMAETFVYPFEMCVKEGDVTSVMCSYNRVNGIPTCADPKLLKQTIRGEWDLHGYIVSDCDSVEEIYKHHQWLGDTQEDAVAQVLKAGLDLDCGMYSASFGKSAVMQGKMKEDDIDIALKNLYMLLMRVGFFDGNPSLASLGKKDICSKEHIELATEAAREGIVLLKNDDATLPFDFNTIETLAVVGPHANATDVMIGNYAGVPCRYTSPLDALSKIAQVKYEPGCADVACKNESMIFKAMQASKNADATIIFAGLDLSVEAEGLDRTDLVLPGYQTQLINQVAMVAKGPVVLVMLTAGGVDISFAKDNPNIKSIIWAGYPGEEGGQAIADVLYGRYNPGGRLPITWYKADYVNQLPMTSMQLRPVDELGYPGRTYRFFSGSTVYPFGHGLGYSTYSYTIPSSQRLANVKLGKYQHCRDLRYTEGAYRPSCPAVLVDDISCDNEFEFEVNVQNNGSLDGTHVIMVYSKPPMNIVGTHTKRVIGFNRVFVPVGETMTVKFSFNVCKSLGIVDYTAYMVLPSGEHTIVVDNGVEAVEFPLHAYFARGDDQLA